MTDNKGEFFILRHLKHHTVFFADKRRPQAYVVHGLVSPIEDVVDWPLPVLVKSVLLPFEDKIIDDGLLAPYALHFGFGIRWDLNQAYRSVQEHGGVLTTLRHLSEDEKRAQRPWKSKDTDGVSPGSRRLEPWR